MIDPRAVNGLERKIRVVLADSSRDYLLLLRSAMEDTQDLQVVGTATDGGTALRLVRETLPDILLTELQLPVTDGLCLLRQLRREKLLPPTMVVSGFVSEYMARNLSAMGVQVYLPKPCSMEDLLSHIRALASPPARRRVRSFDAAIHEALSVFGVMPHLRGRAYLEAAVARGGVDPGVLHGITKILYPELAKRFSTTPVCIEHSIRTAIRDAWRTGSPEHRREYFGDCFEGLERPPGNARFITAIIEHILTSCERVDAWSGKRL